jgi:hypothetical protein
MRMFLRWSGLLHGVTCAASCPRESGEPYSQRCRPRIATLADQTAHFPTRNIVQPRWPHGRHDSLGECIEIQINLFACRRCSTPSARRLACQGRGPERCRFGLFHGKRVANREWRAAESRGVDGRPSVIPVRIQGSSHQSSQWALRGGHGQ